MARAFRTLAILAAVALAAGCSVKESPTPELTGPSELSLALSMSATPDTINQDGSSQSLVVVTARDAAGRAVVGLPIRFDVQKDGKIQDYGVLSAKSVLTGSDGRASTFYTAPAPPRDSPVPEATPSSVSVLATPSGTNYASIEPRAVDIRLVPPGVVPPSDTLAASFVSSPTAPGVGVVVVFNGSGSKSPSGIAAYAWDFGDGTTASGVVAQHTYSTAGTYAVRLTVTDAKGLSAWTTKDVTVAAPAASFTWSPASPVILLPATEVTVTFDAGLSWVDPPAKIATYAWDFGDGSTAVYDIPTARHNFSAGNWFVTLTVTDTAGVSTSLSKFVFVAVK
jgi:PKD repeat protein